MTGTVARPDGQPVEGALVTPRSLDDPAPAVPEIAVLTGADGSFWWDLPPGRFELTVLADGYAAAVGTVDVEVGSIATLNVSLEPSS